MEEVETLLKSLGFEKYISNFKEHGYDQPEAIADIEIDDLTTAMNIPKGHAKMILKRLKQTDKVEPAQEKKKTARTTTTTSSTSTSTSATSTSTSPSRSKSPGAPTTTKPTKSTVYDRLSDPTGFTGTRREVFKDKPQTGGKSGAKPQKPGPTDTKTSTTGTPTSLSSSPPKKTRETYLKKPIFDRLTAPENYTGSRKTTFQSKKVPKAKSGDSKSKAFNADEPIPVEEHHIQTLPEQNYDR